jgi:hypothetical protein
MWPHGAARPPSPDVEFVKPQLGLSTTLPKQVPNVVASLMSDPIFKGVENSPGPTTALSTADKPRRANASQRQRSSCGRD